MESPKTNQMGHRRAKDKMKRLILGREKDLGQENELGAQVFGGFSFWWERRQRRRGMLQRRENDAFSPHFLYLFHLKN